MKMNMILKLSFLSLTAILLANCSAREVVVEANPALDPMVPEAVETKEGVDPRASEQWNLDLIGARGPSAPQADGSKRVVVAILGTGVDYTHEDLKGNIYVNRREWREMTNGAQNSIDRVDDDGNGYVDDFIGYDFVDNDGFPYDRNGSGTAMAGVIGAVKNNSIGISGIVKNVSLLPVRFIDGSGQLLIPNLFKALRYALDAKADVILLHTPSYEYGASAESSEERAMMSALEREMFLKILTDIRNAGIPIIASAGNSGTYVGNGNSLIRDLSTQSNVVLVTSVDKVDARPFLANYSREKIHTSAPGKDVLTTSPGNRYELANGTSIAAAHVAGALALTLNRQFGKIETRKLVEAFIKADASDAVPGMKFETIGGNRLNLAKYFNFFE